MYYYRMMFATDRDTEMEYAIQGKSMLKAPGFQIQF